MTIMTDGKRLFCALIAGCLSFSSSMLLAFDSPYDEKAASLQAETHYVIKANKNEGLEYPLDVWAPATPGHYPVFFFLTGLNGLAPNQAYDLTWKKLAARGVIVVSPEVGVKSPLATKKLGYDFVQLITWMQNNLPQEIKRKGETAVPEMEHLVISGHSSGAKPIVELYKLIHRDVAGLVLIEPVDRDPVNMSKPSVEDDEYFAYGTPLLVLAAGLANQPGHNWGKLWPPCAPDDSSSEYFYKHFAGPKWRVKALDYGHADMLERYFLTALQTTRFCKSADQLDMEPFRSFLAGSIAAFMKSQFAKISAYQPYLEQASLIPVRAEAEFE